MKHRVRFKARMNNLLRDVQSGAFARRQHFVSTGYINNRPRSFPPLSNQEIGRVESFRFISSPSGTLSNN